MNFNRTSLIRLEDLPDWDPLLREWMNLQGTFFEQVSESDYGYNQPHPTMLSAAAFVCGGIAVHGWELDAKAEHFGRGRRGRNDLWLRLGPKNHHRDYYAEAQCCDLMMDESTDYFIAELSKALDKACTDALAIEVRGGVRVGVAFGRIYTQQPQAPQTLDTLCHGLFPSVHAVCGITHAETLYPRQLVPSQKVQPPWEPWECGAVLVAKRIPTSEP